MAMDLNTFRTKINAGGIIQIGRFSCRLLGHEYYFFAETTEVFDSLEDLWYIVKPFLTHMVWDEKDTNES